MANVDLGIVDYTLRIQVHNGQSGLMGMPVNVLLAYK